jgi:hypothetical protein
MDTIFFVTTSSASPTIILPYFAFLILCKPVHHNGNTGHINPKVREGVEDTWKMRINGEREGKERDQWKIFNTKIKTTPYNLVSFVFYDKMINNN